jgi:hypothetical protein
VRLLEAQLPEHKSWNGKKLNSLTFSRGGRGLPTAQLKMSTTLARVLKLNGTDTKYFAVTTDLIRRPFF